MTSITLADVEKVTAPLQPWLDDPEVTEILIDGPGRMLVERRGQSLIEEPCPFASEAELTKFATTVTAALGREANEQMPMVDARLPDGSRVNVVMPPISLMGGPSITIRKLGKQTITFENLLAWGCLSSEMLQFITACVRGQLNLVTAGGTGSGKTTVMNLIAGLVPPDERIITIENAAELQLQHGRVVSLESRPADANGKGEVTIEDMVINALRMRPDRIVIGEARGPEVIHILQAMNTGYDGSMFTIHATSPRDTMQRLETMAAMSNLSIPLLTIRQQLATAVDVIVQQTRLADGSRKIVKITEVVGMQGDAIELQDIFEFRQTGVSTDGKIQGQYLATGYIPKFLPRLHALGQEIPMSFFAQ